MHISSRGGGDSILEDVELILFFFFLKMNLDILSEKPFQTEDVTSASKL
jgi:hypothetical protein